MSQHESSFRAVVAFCLFLYPVLNGSLGAQGLRGLFEGHVSIEGKANGDRLGWSVAGAGDVNRDGFLDVIVGAYRANPGEKSNAGSAYVYSGRDGEMLWQFNGTEPGDEFGWSVAGAGDVNGDEFADVIVGARHANPGEQNDAGSAFVFSGTDGSLLLQFDGAASGDQLGRSVAGAGDVNQDGFVDVIVGANHADPGDKGDAGSAFVYSGEDGSLLLQFDGAASGDHLGQSVAGARDMNGDGFADVIVGAPRADPGDRSNAGSVFVYSGMDGSLLWQFDGAAGGDRLGHSVASAGDVNQDSVLDVIVGAPFADPDDRIGAGSAVVYSGMDGMQLLQFDGSRAGNDLGWSVAGAGDVNQDGFDDLIVGAFDADPEHVGSAIVFSGKDGANMWQFDGEANDDQLGSSVAGPGDVNGDGFLDVLVGVHRANPGGRSDAGMAQVFVYKPALANFGTGLPGIGNVTPRIGTGDELPRIGNSDFKVEITLAYGVSPCIIALSLTQAEEERDGLTLYGDFLTPGVFVAWVLETDGIRFFPTTGTASVAFPIPNESSLLGLTTYWQGFVEDHGSSSPLNFSHTDGLAVTVIR